ncbi:hypothetical protein HYT33_03520 [Candidatus Roizmanbacteria bacterium]|nr:hypothetical protein [Candidatus Roizmanbacteria bacterium]
MSTPEARNSQLRASTSEKIVPTWKLTIGGKSSKELQKELRKGGFDVSYYAQDMLQSRDFTTLKKPEEINLVKVSVSDLGFNDVATTDQIYQAAKERGYELCPPEVGAHLRLADQEQPMGERFSIGMKQITDRASRPSGGFCSSPACNA